MKYSLRSLMIGITLFCVLLGGRVEFLRRGAVYHEIAAANYRDTQGIDLGVNILKIWHHEQLAKDYRNAILRPWTLVDERPPPEILFDPPTGMSATLPKSNAPAPIQPSMIPIRSSLGS